MAYHANRGTVASTHHRQGYRYRERLERALQEPLPYCLYGRLKTRIYDLLKQFLTNLTLWAAQLQFLTLLFFVLFESIFH